MGLTSQSTGARAADAGLNIQKQSPDDLIVALAGNPNVGKSTVFNQLTGLNQHTGNWPGKTVTNAQGTCTHQGRNYILVDIPGTYSLMAHSVEEEVARDFICFGGSDAVIVVCDATCLERNLNLVLQTIEITGRVVVCVNLMDEARKKGISIDLSQLSALLGVPVVGASARAGKGLDQLMDTVGQLAKDPYRKPLRPVSYPTCIENAVSSLESAVKRRIGSRLNPRWVALRLLDQDESLIRSLLIHTDPRLLEDPEISELLEKASAYLEEWGLSGEQLKDSVTTALVRTAELTAMDVVSFREPDYLKRDRKLDKILTSKRTGIPIMLALLAGVFWITIVGSNYPSELLSVGLFWLEDRLMELAIWIGIPSLVRELLITGVYRVLAWVVSVMLPPMAIFFPLFTLLEDFGYLPRVAFNLDRYFKKCSACGKQALTMCMGFGCNAAGIVGCRIIDSPRERLIAIITNNFVPCNGRFPILITMISIFFAGSFLGPFQSVVSALMLTGVILFGILMTFLVSKLLSLTILKGVPSSFTLELPPYRKPQIGKVIVRSVFDRTLFVLGRAVAAAVPAGFVIWVMANVTLGEQTILVHFSSFLDPLGQLMGMDGIILMAFILGLPANEIVIPIMIMAYLSAGQLMDITDLSVLQELFAANGWTWVTAVSVMLFALMHWPCATTCLTIRKETQSVKWTAVSFLVPTIAGIVTCILFNLLAKAALYLL